MRRGSAGVPLLQRPHLRIERRLLRVRLRGREHLVEAIVADLHLVRHEREAADKRQALRMCGDWEEGGRARSALHTVGTQWPPTPQ